MHEKLNSIDGVVSGDIECDPIPVGCLPQCTELLEFSEDIRDTAWANH